MADNDKRIEILTNSEVEELYCVPRFTDAEREFFFELDDAERALFSPRNDAITNAYRILLLGYFKYKPVVLNPTVAEVKTDLVYIRNKYQIPVKLTHAELSSTQKSRIYASILGFYGHEIYDDAKHQLTDFVRRLSAQIVEPREVFDSCIHHLAEKKVAIPAYSTLQKIISAGLQSEERALEEKILFFLGDSDVETLKQMAYAEEKKPLITQIKKLPKSFQKKEIYAEIEVFEKISEVFPNICASVEALGLSKKNIDYFAYLVTYYSISRLRRLSAGAFALYLSCFLYQRYFQISDILIQGFIYHVRKLEDEAEIYGKDKQFNELKNMDEKYKKASPLIDIFYDGKIKGRTAFSVAQKKAYEILPKDQMPGVSKFIAGIKTDHKEFQWEFYEAKHSRIKTILRKLFLCHTFDSRDESAQPLLRQVRLSKEEMITSGKMQNFDARLIKPQLKPYLLFDADDSDGGVNLIRAEVLMYIRIKDRLEDLKFYVEDSLSYKWYEDDFVLAEDVPELVAMSNYITLKRPINEILAEKKAVLEKKRKAVGARLGAGENSSVIFTENNGKIKWTIKRRAKDEVDKSEDFYSQIKQLHIGDIIAFAERNLNFSSQLTHIRLRKPPSNLNAIIACIVANGTRYGTHHMATLCNLPYDELRQAEKNHLRGETIHAANDVISNAISQLEIFKYYNIQENVLHASFDGQRFESRYNTISTHYSSKYFGRGKGLSAVSLCANHVPVNAEIMKPYTHESHYLFDVLYNNTSEIKPDVISTDTHGANQFNFAILDCHGWEFAPRYKRPGKILASLFGYTESENGCEVTLLKPINYDLIEKNWAFIQQVMVSLHSQEVSQANLVRKMSRFKAKSNPFKALAEYDRLIKCIYLLDFIDDSSVRGYVQRALNRGESYHALLRRIEEVNGSQFRGNSDAEISLWYECSRLIANCVIYFNSSILSLLVQGFERTNQLVKLEEMKHCSPVAWTHINFNGSYTFSFDGKRLDLQDLLREILGT
ncbi:MAG: Tn3 family transposase [Spongiibacteraceae bacterium]